MLRNLFVMSIAGVGIFYGLRGPFYVLLLYLWIAYFRPEQWVWGDFVGQLNLSFIAGLALVGSLLLSRERERIRLDLRTVVLFLFLLQSILSTALGPHAEYSWAYWPDLAKSLVVTYAVATLVSDRLRFRLTLLVIAVSLGFEASKQGWLQLLLNPGAKNVNRIPPFGDENGAALAMFMLTPLLLALASTAARRSEAVVHRFMAVGVVFRGIATYSRGGFLSAGVLGMLYFLRSRHKVRAAVGVGLLAGLILTVFPEKFWDRMETIRLAADRVINRDDDGGPETDRGDRSAMGRLHFWTVAVDMARDRPLTGVGYLGYNPSFDAYDFSGGEFGTHRSVHSAWFGVLAELGFPGLMLFGSTMLLALIACRRARRQARQGTIDAEFGVYATALETSLFVYAVGACFIPFQYVHIFWNIAGLTMALDRITKTAVAARAVDNAPAPAFGDAPVPSAVV
ncbi:MAG: putative O-glycosylation ligase, exosortase A system-associated [Acidobacteria bacterium]|nr:putative O-glycosylation ligase, exosortase A system-associated [Acidobacteriota bacterium]